MAGTILGWIEHYADAGLPLRVGIGSSNYNAIDNVLNEILELINRRTAIVGAFACPIRVTRVRSDSSAPPLNDQIEDMPRTSAGAPGFVNALKSDGAGISIVGGTWQQFGKLADNGQKDIDPSAQWFDLIVIDEASQVPVAAAAAYFLLLKSDGHVVLAGDDRRRRAVGRASSPARSASVRYDRTVRRSGNCGLYPASQPYRLVATMAVFPGSRPPGARKCDTRGWSGPAWKLRARV